MNGMKRVGCFGVLAIVAAANVGLADPPVQKRWSVVLTTAAGLPQDVWIAGHGNNTEGWTGGGSICLGVLAQGIDVGQHVLLVTDVIEAGVVGEDGAPVEPGTYLAPSEELGDREFEVVDGVTFYLMIRTTVKNSNVPGFEVGDESVLMFTFNTVMGRTEQLVVAWAETPTGFLPFLNEGLMATNLRLGP